MDVQKMSCAGMQLGLGIAVVPAAVTSLIACSKIIFVNVIADVAVRILTANKYTMAVHGISFIKVPFLWQVSQIAAIVGVSILVVSAIASIVNKVYENRTVTT